jgi:endonuclease/exonuclease/phosphatase family metal-dependent hydrolase
MIMPMKFYITIISLFVSSVVFAQSSIKVMTYNIRLDVASDGVNQWSNRKEKLPALIAKYDPDFVGLQEAMHHQLMDILKALPQYGYIGVGRDDGKEKGEYSAILYKKDKFNLKSQDTKWLSKTPTVPGSKDWDAAITRIVTQGIFIDKKTKRQFNIFNTHFDHIGKEARKESVAVIKKEVLSHKGTKDLVVVMGDFNSTPDEEPYQKMALDYTDARPATSTQGTFCTFQVNGPECRIIDHIFYQTGLKVVDYKVITDNDGTNYPSDHLPVMAAFSFD